MSLDKQVGYLKGMLEFMDDDSKKKEEMKVIEKLIDIIEDLSDTIQDLEEELVEQSMHINEIDEDLADVEDYVYELDEDDCGCCGADEDDAIYEVTCPECQETLFLDEEALDEEALECPSCGAPLEFGIEFDDDEE